MYHDQCEHSLWQVATHYNTIVSLSSTLHVLSHLQFSKNHQFQLPYLYLHSYSSSLSLPYSLRPPFPGAVSLSSSSQFHGSCSLQAATSSHYCIFIFIFIPSQDSLFLFTHLSQFLNLSSSPSHRV
ncbi:hypothetical protein MANES_17G056350v8 [Manihot esculenta]|uniref:Uncharacterized protein n=1 Tax=Manihot esculenta TaxID=3983 RepID=A0ACB7G3U5_MANES|nr:hypothetical protein MANES_17G056350v8 [Manihot esculenta]